MGIAVSCLGGGLTLILSAVLKGQLHSGHVKIVLEQNLHSMLFTKL